MSVSEKVAIFLYALTWDASNREVQERFQHSGETISRYFNEVLTIVCSLVVNVIKLEDPEFRNTPQKIEMDARYMPHFKVKLMNLYIINAKYKLFGYFFQSFNNWCFLFFM
jgi:hypothetical protein